VGGGQKHECSRGKVLYKGVRYIVGDKITYKWAKVGIFVGEI